MESNKENKYLKAKERVAEIKKFYSNFMFYCLFIIGLAGLNYYVDGFRNPWFLWAAFGWGIGILFQALKVFNWSPFIGKNWEERKLKEFMEEEKRKTNKDWE